MSNTPSLITEYNVNSNEGKVTLYMADLSPRNALAVLNEVQSLQQKEPPVSLEFTYADGHGKIEISSDNLASLALRTAQIMLRHVADLAEGKQYVYASKDDIRDVLNQMKAHAQSQNSTHVVTVIDKLISTVSIAQRE